MSNQQSPPIANNPRILTPDLKEWMDRRMRDLKSSFNCVSIGTVISFDPTTDNGAPLTATIQINFLRVISGGAPIASASGDKASDLTIPYQPLVKCPVFILGGGGSYLTMPIAAGDTCVVLFCDKDMDIWWATGTTQAPNSQRTHDLNDGIALVGVRPATNPIQDFNTAVASLIDASGERLTQVGMIMGFGGSTAPSGWLLCQGQEVSRTTYARLFAIISTNYGVGNGTTTFNIPDGRGKNLIGYLSGDSYFGTIGGTGGEETHLLTGPESGIQAHDHSYGIYNGPASDPIITAGNASQPITTGNTNITGPTDAQTAHNNIQPYQTIGGAIIKY